MGALRYNFDLIFANLLFGANFSFYVSLTRNYLDFQQIFMLQVLAASIFFIPFALFSKQSYRIPLRDFGNILIVTVLIVYGWMFMLLWGASYTSPIDASTISTLGPVFTILTGHFLLREKNITWARRIGVVLGFAGAAFLLFDKGFRLAPGSSGLGNALVLVAVVAIAVNTVIIKPSAYASATSAIIAKLIRRCFPSEYVAVVEGGRRENTELLEQRFDYIFFTGGVEVGRLVMEKASRYLTPITLELGGKSPCIVDRSANLKLAARRIAFGKFLNAGQTCVAPDYVYVEASVKNEFLAYLQDSLHTFFQGSAMDCATYPKIINKKHFDRLCALMQEGSICMGGAIREETCQIEPTVIENISWDNAIMQEEIFGPLLPILTFTDLDEVIQTLLDKEKPLALYLFSEQKQNQHRVLSALSYGGGCINDTIIHLATSAMGFGGVGQSGMGSYHGYDSFQTFSHCKSIVKKANWIDLPFRYHPYTTCKQRLVRLFLK